MEQSAVRSNPINRGSRGFSLAESMVAIAVLSIGVLSLAQLIPFATRIDYGARTDSTATFVAMREMEQILAQPWSVTSFTDAADDAGNTATVNLACTCMPTPCAGTAPTAAPLLPAGTINFSIQPPPPGYSCTYAINETPVAGSVKVNRGAYDVRWHITCQRYGLGGTWNGAGFYNIVVAARPVGNVPGMIAIPAHVRAVKMK